MFFAKTIRPSNGVTWPIPYFGIRIQLKEYSDGNGKSAMKLLRLCDEITKTVNFEDTGV